VVYLDQPRTRRESPVCTLLIVVLYHKASMGESPMGASYSEYTYGGVIDVPVRALTMNYIN
jgi:hypothetical protein